MPRKISDRVLLIGNGINLTDNANHFSASDIAQRFHAAIVESRDIFNSLFFDDLKVDSKDLYIECGCLETENIERLLGRVYSYIDNLLDPSRKGLSDNIIRRIIDMLLQVGLKAIFVQDNRLKCAHVPQDFVNQINSYKSFYTLNYHEEWDPNSDTLDRDPRYLHGKFWFEKYRTLIALTSKPIMFCSSTRYNCMPEYADIIQAISTTFDIIQFEEFETLTMVPDVITKTAFHKGLAPSKTLKPGNDLYPRDDVDIYKDIASVTNLDIFGMSPYGDESLLEKIKQIPDVTVFIYDITSPNGRNEELTWKKVIPHATCFNSNLFIE